MSTASTLPTPSRRSSVVKIALLAPFHTPTSATSGGFCRPGSMRLIVSHLRLWSPLVREGGVLLGDDYLVHWKGVRKAVDEFAAKVGATVEVYGLKWLLRVPSPKPAAWPRLPPKRTVWAFEGGAGGWWCGQEEERRDVRRDEEEGRRGGSRGRRRGVLATKGDRRSGGYTIMGAGFAVRGRGGGVSACRVQRLIPPCSTVRVPVRGT